MLASWHMVVHGTNSPFAALHKFGSYRGFICRAFTVATPVSFDPEPPSELNVYTLAA